MADYCVVVSRETHAVWREVVDALVQKQQGGNWVVEVVVFERDVEESITSLSHLLPSHTAFVATVAECSRTFVRKVHHITRSLDPSHLFSDTVWGIVAAANKEDALLLASEARPLSIHRVFAGTVEGSEIDMFQCGTAYNELVEGHVVRKRPPPHDGGSGGGGGGGTSAEPGAYEGDETVHLARDLNAEHPDMIITSGHARQRVWNLGYRFKSGTFRVRHSHSGPQLYAECLNCDEIPIDSPNPKVLSAAGNCLMAHMCDEGSMACAWMHSAGVRQMSGYIMPTWYGYGGWGVHKYFTRLPGKFTFAEAFFANMQSLLVELQAIKAAATGKSRSSGDGGGGADVDVLLRFSDGSAHEVDRFCEEIYRACFASQGTVGGVDRHHLGLRYDRDNVVFYGDPAWDARLAGGDDGGGGEGGSSAADLPYTVRFEELARDESAVTWLCTVDVRRDGLWSAPGPDDKECSPGRPPFAFLPCGWWGGAAGRGVVRAAGGGARDGGAGVEDLGAGGHGARPVEDGGVRGKRLRRAVVMSGPAVATRLFVLFTVQGASKKGDKIVVIVRGEY